MQEIENFNFILPDIKDEFGYARDCVMNIKPYYVEQEEALGVEEFSANVLCKTYSFPNLFVSQLEEKTFYMLKISGSALCILSEEKYNLFMEAMMERFENSQEKRRDWAFVLYSTAKSRYSPFPSRTFLLISPPTYSASS